MRNTAKYRTLSPKETTIKDLSDQTGTDHRILEPRIALDLKFKKLNPNRKPLTST